MLDQRSRRDLLWLIG